MAPDTRKVIATAVSRLRPRRSGNSGSPLVGDGYLSIGKVLSDRLRMGLQISAFVIHDVHVDTTDARPHGSRSSGRRKRYPTDLTDAEWVRIEPLLPRFSRRGRKPSVDLREVLNAIRYMTRSGGGWRMLPKDFPPWQTVYWWFRRFVRLMLFRTIHDVALMMDRERCGREASPEGGVLDSQTVKASAHGAKRGFDGGKKTVGRKRHVAVDTDGRLLMVNLTPADISDSAGAQAILDAIRKRWPWLKPKLNS